jgi:hypothetical protein
VWQRLRTIVLEPAAQEAADSFCEEFPRFEEAWDALQWLLARHPRQVGSRKAVNGREYWACVRAPDEIAGTPQIAVVYSFDNDEVVIYDVKATQIQPE